MIPFSKPYHTGKELEYIAEVYARGQLAGDGYFTRLCQNWLEQHTGSPKSLLTHSCTAALEMAAILADIQPGDEVIMPSYTFVSTANAFVLRGGIPVFVDIRLDTFNIDETLIEKAITSRTKAIVPVHYAGVACEMDRIMDIARRHKLLVIEDAAQGIIGTYKGKALGAIGHLGALSFHETKNITSGEGGALLINDSRLFQRAEIIREKGTNRSEFLRHQVDKYTWVDIGSSYLPSEIIAASLWAQMEDAERITQKRLVIWQQYHEAFESLERNGHISRPAVPEGCIHNAHIYYMILHDQKERNQFIDYMKQQGVNCSFHYVPLHSSPAGLKYGRVFGDMQITNNNTCNLVRLPLWPELTKVQQNIIVDLVNSFLR